MPNILDPLKLRTEIFLAKITVNIYGSKFNNHFSDLIFFSPVYWDLNGFIGLQSYTVRTGRYQKRPLIVCHRIIAQAFLCDYNVKPGEELCFTLWNSSGCDPFLQFSHHCDLVHTILDYLPSNLHYYPDIWAPDLQIRVFGISTGGLTDISKLVFIFCFPNLSHLSSVLQHRNWW